MERHILTWSSGGGDKTAVCVTKIKDSQRGIVGEVVFAGTDEGAVILEDLLEHNEYEAALKEIKELRTAEKKRIDRTIKKVERALGIKLYDWQKAFIFHNKSYGLEVSAYRCTGKTLAHCLRLCLSEGEPIEATLSPSAKSDFLRYLGEDGCNHTRSRFFIDELHKVYNTLNAAGGIGLREITFRRL